MKTAEELYEKEFGSADSLPKESVIRLLKIFARAIKIEQESPHPTTLPSDEEIYKLGMNHNTIGTDEEMWGYEVGMKEMRSLCEAKIAEMEKYKSLVIELAEWSRKYPRDRIYSMRKIKMDDELIALENKAKELTTTQ